MKKTQLILILLFSLIFIFLGCRKEPKSIFGKTHRILTQIVDIAKNIEDSEDVRKQFARMKELLFGFHKYLKMIGSMNMQQLEIESKKNENETKEFYDYLNRILQEKNTGFIKDMQRIGSLSLDGQRLRNAFFEAIYLFRNQVIENLKQRENQSPPGGNQNTPVR